MSMFSRIKIKKLLVGLLAIGTMEAYAEVSIQDADHEEKEAIEFVNSEIKDHSIKKNIIKQIQEAKSAYNQVKKDPFAKSQIATLKKNFKNFRDGKISKDLKNALSRFNKECSSGVNCESAKLDAITELKNHFKFDENYDEYIYSSHFRKPPGNDDNLWLFDFFLSCVSDPNFHMLFYGLDKDKDCVALGTGEYYIIKSKFYGPGLHIAGSASVTICPIGMRPGTHIGLTAAASGLFGVEASTFFGASGMCVEVGVNAGIGAKAVLRVSKIR